MVPAEWEVERRPRGVAVSAPERPEMLVVSTFPLRREFRPDLWDEAVAELEVVARDLAQRLSGSSLLLPGETRQIAGRRARVYEVRYRRAGDALIERIAFLFRGRREYQLTCRIDASDPDGGTEACRELFATFEVRG